jgi:hypothetical protein
MKQPGILSLLLLILLGTAVQHATAQPYTLTGRVMELTRGGPAPRPLSGVTVRVTPGKFRTTTDDNGNYTIGGLRRRRYTVRISSPYHHTVRRTIRMTGDQMLNVDLATVGAKQPDRMPNGEMPMKSAPAK